MHKLSFIVIAISLLISPIARAERITDIVIENNQRVEIETIKSYMDISAGDQFDQEKINSSLKKMFATGLFADISVSRSGGAVVIKVTENPIVNKVTFEGNKRINDDVLTNEVSLSPRSVYTKAKIQDDTNRIQDIYRKSGRYSVSVEPKIVELDQNRVNIIFEISEGKKATIGKIYFLGNQMFSDNDLKNVITSKESHWYNFFTSNDTYDSDKVAYDSELLRKYYTSKGYADFRVISNTAEITQNKESFILTFTLEEGDKYKFGDMNITSSLPTLQVDPLREVIKTKKDKTFDSSQIDKTVDAMTTKLNDTGYAFVEISPKFAKNEESKTIGIIYQIAEGPKVYIDRINITGNVRTLDKVIRREFRLAEGDPFNSAKIKRSQQRIQNLGFFDKVDIDSEKTDVADKANLKVSVAEKSTGELSFGAGYSTHDGALGNISLSEKNLLGRGQDLRIGLQRSQAGLTIDLGFTEPYFMDKDLSAGFDAWSIKSNRMDNAASSTDSKGFSPRASYSITENLRHTLRYIIVEDNVTNIRDDASALVKSQAGSTIGSIIGQTFVYDKRDSRFSPKSGYYLSLDQRLAGLGGDLNYIKHEAKAGYYIPVYKEEFILKFDLSGGHIAGYNGKDIRFADNFRLTGRKVRGFSSVGFGPTDISTSTVDPTVLGGKRYYAQSTELEFPIAFVPDELGFKGFIFNDLGSVTGYDDNLGLNIIDRDRLHASAGIGFSWVSPLGPLNVSYAKPYLKEDFDDTQQLQFDFGTRF
ncbi:MAG: yaeT [Rickettsiaceae bacterium]|jgi:outer membrane protein insertion porin family|nr:yaeT [Rickettsiaceae bacterium]